MIVQHLTIPKYDWDVEICYDVKPRDTERIINGLYRLGCNRKHLSYARNLLRSGVPNQGLTYSDRYNHHTLIVIGHATSVGEFISTTTHEINHMTDHISQQYGMPLDSEENAYLVGDISKAIYDDAVEKLVQIFRI